eukprot:COSAG01_NODE_58578_length_305_cov_0.752427_1_plen_73_part_01
MLALSSGQPQTYGVCQDTGATNTVSHIHTGDSTVQACEVQQSLLSANTRVSGRPAALIAVIAPWTTRKNQRFG